MNRKKKGRLPGRQRPEKQSNRDGLHEVNILSIVLPVNVKHVSGCCILGGALASGNANHCPFTGKGYRAGYTATGYPSTILMEGGRV